MNIIYLYMNIVYVYMNVYIYIYMNSLLASPCFVVAFAFANFDTLYTVIICNYIL